MKSIRKRIMEIIHGREITQRELREKLGISKSYLSEILSSMEREGIIKRKKISKRTVIVSENKERSLRVGLLKSSEYAAVFLTKEDIDEFSVDISIYNNSLEEMKDLLTEKIDIAFSPVVTGLIFHVIDENIVVLAGCARGGSGIVYTSSEGSIGSTLLSTMDIISRKFSKFSRIRYFSSPEEMVEAFDKNEIDGLSIWEPYFTMIKKGEKISAERDMLCCGLITLSKNIDEKVKKFKEKFLENSRILRNGGRREEASILLSKALNIDHEIILKSLDSYIFDTHINDNDIEKIVQTININVSRESLKNYLPIKD